MVTWASNFGTEKWIPVQKGRKASSTAKGKTKMDSTPQGWYKENDFKEKNMAAIGVAVCDSQG